MLKLDFNCLVGNWPFRRLYKNSFSDLERIHEENGIDYGYVSSLESIFYNDPFEGDLELNNIICNSNYKHVLTINPTIPGFEYDIEKGLKLFDIKGVRIYPGYHKYSLEDKQVFKLVEILKKHQLPLFLTFRMVDERLNHLIKPIPVNLEEIKAFLNNFKDLNIILLNILFREVENLQETINSNNNMFFDISGMGHYLFTIERLLSIVSEEKIIYGSLFPLKSLKSTLFQIEKAEISEIIKAKILAGNEQLIYRGVGKE